MSKVQLYVYDLSNGLAKQMSRQLTGRQIDGIWHTSVVVFGKEVFYGLGISITAPGQSHHGAPLQVVDMGETALDEDTFSEYLSEISSHYTADKYHLLDFNCNSFTNDCVGFLTGGSIPAWIKDLPSDFLSTPFGAALRPTIDAMFRRPTPGAAPTPPPAPNPAALQQAAAASPEPALASALLQAVAAQAYSTGSLSAPTSLPRSPAPGSSTVAAPIHFCTNTSSLHGLLQSHRVAVVFFTSATCGPCKMIEPVFEELAHQKTHGPNGGRAAFVKVDMAVGSGGQVGAELGVRATPTFLFFLDGKKQHELKGVNAPELRTQVDLLLYQAFPPHPHTKLSLPAVEGLSMNPILFQQVPPLDTVSSKLVASIDAAASSSDIQVAKKTLTTTVLPYLKLRLPDKKAAGKKPAVPTTPQLLTSFSATTKTLSAVLAPAQLFPLVDMWRLAVVDDAAAANWLAIPTNPNPDVLQLLLEKALEDLDASDPAQKSAGRNYILTVLRLLANGFVHPALGRALLSRASPAGKRSQVTRVVVAALLHEDAAVRTAAASLAFNVAATVQKSRIDRLRGGAALVAVEEDEEWEAELVSAVLEALSNEVQSEDVVHRLVAALAFLLRLSPSYEGQLAPLLEVLQSRQTLESKLQKGGCGEKGVQKPEVRRLIQEVAAKLCPAS
ncbi:PPPDE putative peptidase domain-containing protein [Ganoderma leucocontextum]|nr:PPPDE putative peptidase domain-containing protein [Ganoderma leucocontextum]